MIPESNIKELETVGTLGESYTKLLWPELTLTEKYSKEDRLGIDGFLGKETVQIKTDRPMIRTGNFFHQSRHLSDTGVEHNIREYVDFYIFTTWNKEKVSAIKIPKGILDTLVEDMIEVSFRPDSWGYLLSPDELPLNSYERREVFF